MFGWFRRRGAAAPRVQQADDRVYLHTDARADAVARACHTRAPGAAPLLLVTPFVGSVAPHYEALTRRGVVVALPERSARDAAARPGAALLVDYAGAEAYFATQPSRAHVVLQIERHPLRERDAWLVDALGAWAPGSALEVFLSLDDGLLRVFDEGGRLRTLCAQLGVDPAEELSHRWVHQAIARAQEKLAARARAVSATETVGAAAPAPDFDTWCARTLRPR